MLASLSDSQGNLLDDVELTNSLSKAKTTTRDINRRMMESKAMAGEIKEAREKYFPVAVRGSLLYFCVADLSRVDSMYQFSLSCISKLMRDMMEKVPSGKDLGERIEHLVDGVTSGIFRSVCRSLFQRHRRIFVFQLASAILWHEKKMINEQVRRTSRLHNAWTGRRSLRLTLYSCP